MSLFPATFIDDLRTRADIVRMVQDYVPLKKAGNTWKGLCPFHGEKTPSFHVNPDKGFFYCFGCQAGGDVFKFVEMQEKVGFQDAVRILAQKVGMTVPEPTGGDDRGDSVERETLLKVHEIAAARFREQLASPAGARARQQLAARGVSAETVERLGLGFAMPSRDGLRTWLGRQGFEPALLVKSGLVVQRDDGTLIDRFRGRLMIPICRDSGAIVAFGGRSMDAEQQPKYLEFAGDADLLEGPHALRPPLDEGGHPAGGLRGAGRRVFRLRANAAGRRGERRRVVRHGADDAAGTPAPSLHGEDRPELRPGCGGPGGGRTVVTAPRPGGLPGECRPPAARRRPGRVHQEAGGGGLHGAAPDLEAVPRLPARSGGAGRGLRQRRGETRVPEPDASHRGPGAGCGRTRPVCGPAGAQGPHNGRRRPRRDPESRRGAAPGADAPGTAEFWTGSPGREGA